MKATVTLTFSLNGNRMSLFLAGLRALWPRNTSITIQVPNCPMEERKPDMNPAPYVEEEKE